MVTPDQYNAAVIETLQETIRHSYKVKSDLPGSSTATGDSASLLGFLSTFQGVSLKSATACISSSLALVQNTDWPGKRPQHRPKLYTLHFDKEGQQVREGMSSWLWAEGTTLNSFSYMVFR